MVLKSYVISTSFSSGVLLEDLHDEIEVSGTVTDFIGVNSDGANVTVLGEAMNESDLDVVIAAHTPDYTKIFVSNTVQENKIFADQMMQKMKEKNLLEGLSSIDQAAWVHHRLRKVDYTLSDETTVVQIDVLNLVVSGDIETAEAVLGQMTADDMSETYHWWTQSRIDWIRNEIRAYLGWPLL